GLQPALHLVGDRGLLPGPARRMGFLLARDASRARRHRARPVDLVPGQSLLRPESRQGGLPRRHRLVGAPRPGQGPAHRGGKSRDARVLLARAHPGARLVLARPGRRFGPHGGRVRLAARRTEDVLRARVASLCLRSPRPLRVVPVADAGGGEDGFPRRDCLSPAGRRARGRDSMSGSKLAWRWARLRAMTPSEVAWRISEDWRARWESVAAGRERYRPWRSPTGAALATALRASLTPLVPAAEWRGALRAEFPGHFERLGKRARAVREGKVMLFAREYAVGVPPDWHFDPGSRAHAPPAAAAQPDYRDLGRVGSARRIWELNRHHHLAEVAQWAWAAEDRDAARFVAEEWRDWCAAHPPPVGINWTSGLELAIRTLAWAQSLALLLDLGEGWVDEGTLALVTGAWARQIEHVRAHDSRYSSANNHRIGEAAAVAVAGHALRFHPRAADWWAWGKQTLETEIDLQIAPDGVGREQAF